MIDEIIKRCLTSTNLNDCSTVRKEVKCMRQVWEGFWWLNHTTVLGMLET